MRTLILHSFVLALLALNACAKQHPDVRTMIPSGSPSANATLDTATFGAGCFWCVEAQFQMLDGVMKVTSGFAGGTVKNPSYKEVCTGETGHAEVCQIVYDPSKISYDEMLAAFWTCHDPTQL